MLPDQLSEERPPYLTLTITQALSLPDPPHPEPRQHADVNSMLDFRATHSPDLLAVGFTSLSKSSSEWNCTTLTYAQIRKLALTLADKLRQNLPALPPNPNSPNATPLVAVLSPSGVDLFGHIVALWRLGFGVLCIAPNTPPESIANLLRLTSTPVVLAHTSQRSAAEQGVSHAASGDQAIEATVVTTLENVCQYLDAPQGGLDQKQSDQNPKSAATAEDVLVTMHTSGSSGLPKPIYQLHRFWTNTLVPAAGTTLSAFTTTPLFHGGMSDMLRSFQAGSSIFFHPAADPGALSSAAICSAVQCCSLRQSVSYFLSVPYILDLLYEDPSQRGRDMLRSMELVSTGGAPLPQQLGDAMVADRIKLVSRLGSSECGFLMSSWRDFGRDAEWSYLRIPDHLGQRLLRFETDAQDSETAGASQQASGPVELVVSSEWPTKLVANRPDGSYATSDLYAPHPSKPNTWKYESRSDDTLVLVSGKKVSAPVAETLLKRDPSVAEAIVFGANRAILGALVFVSPQASVFGQQEGENAEEMAWNKTTKIKILKSLKPILDEINQKSPPQAQLAVEMIYLLPPSEVARIPRASKGSLQRGRAYQQYAKIIDGVYADFEEGRSLSLPDSDNRSATNGIEKADADGKLDLSAQELVGWMIDTVEKINGTRVSSDADLFVAGVDSIQAARVRAAIHQRIQLGGQILAKNVVYDYPTPTLLARHVANVRSNKGDGQGQGGGEDREQAELQLMSELVRKYSDFASVSSGIGQGHDGLSANEANGQAEVQGRGTLYILTGATGGLGAQILAQIVLSAGLDDGLWLLVRASDDAEARRRVMSSLSEKRLLESCELRAALEGMGARVRYLSSDLSRADCGLTAQPNQPATADAYARVVTIHAAWAVNFVLTLASFTAQIEGLQNLIHLHESLAATAVAPTSSNNGTMSPVSAFGFCSSTASVLGSEPGPSGRYEEVIPAQPESAGALGYARSKWVGEHLVAAAASASASAFRSHSRYTVLRIGQLCSDTTHGVWSTSEAWPILISISTRLGNLPRIQEPLDWLAIDVAARAVLDILGSSATAIEHSKTKRDKQQVEVYNIANCQSCVTWDHLAAWLSKELDVSPIEPSAWLDELQEKELDDRGLLALWTKNFASSSQDSNAQPSRPVFTTSNTERASARFQEWPGVDKGLMHKTIQHWKQTGFL
ncbi:acetyl-CoA synthetase-like protein [Testicularia cyperi]|uniref:Acetyl-CoA synthetase-like protein n=1 Tax=Testicularia cyperi TaxID=1882483 RepID=A0A317XPG9_9BASI|nr:acetyl-CoA synthetase-like protein [Testicularia cyperi]